MVQNDVVVSEKEDAIFVALMFDDYVGMVHVHVHVHVVDQNMNVDGECSCCVEDMEEDFDIVVPAVVASSRVHCDCVGCTVDYENTVVDDIDCAEDDADTEADVVVGNDLYSVVAVDPSCHCHCHSAVCCCIFHHQDGTVVVDIDHDHAHEFADAEQLQNVRKIAGIHS